MGTIIGVTNQKGGVAKTATAINLSVALARRRRKTLLIDLDQQGSISRCLGLSLRDDLLPIAEAIKQRRAGEIVVETSTPNLFVMPGDNSLDNDALSTEKLRDTVLQRALSPIRDRYDFIICDSAPRLDLVVTNLIMAADWLILPCDADRESVESLKATLSVVFAYLEYRPEAKPGTFYKVLVNLYDERHRIMNAWLERQLAMLGNPPFRTWIHHSTAFVQARNHSLSIFDYAEAHRASEGCKRGVSEFEQLAEEVMDYVNATTDAEDHRLSAAG